ncbi:response regulator [Schlegelella sp. S2-27]|uniref:histidine kinase n=1 Tax=Caldimonas mangrovi TaxID=2944811 RepID=A0ABT0YIT6_9BURK|nr:response regulator [Caldimonas mangrovi]MCM5678076.1 response regulator [Caldimonas mangrovi]
MTQEHSPRHPFPLDLQVADMLERDMQRGMFWLAAAVSLAGGLGFAAFFLAKGPRVVAWADVALVALTLVLAVYVRTGGRAERGLTLLAAGLTAVLTAKMWLQGGLYAPTLWWLLVLPWLVMLAGPVRAGAWLGAVVLGILALTYALQRADALPAAALSSAPRLHQMLSMGGALMLYGGFVGFSLKLRDDLQRELRYAMLELQCSRDEAWRASQVKAHFLSNMSHELRTPINGILGATELLRATPLDMRQQQIVSMQRQSLDSLMALVNDVLDYSRLDAGGVQLERVPLALRTAVFDALELYAGAAHEKGLELTCSQDPEVPETVLGDPTRLRQVLSHLVSNAVKFTHQGGVHVHVGMVAGDPVANRVRLRIEVHDTGIGVDVAQLPQLFGVFSQGDSSRARRAGGAGIGLALCRELAELMGGKVEATGAPGQGSCFTVEINCERTTELAEPAPPPLPEQHVFVVAGHHRLVLHFDAILRGTGVSYEIRAVAPSRADLRAAHERQVAAVLIDERLLGARAGERLEQIVREAGLPVLLMRALTRDSSQIALDGVFVLSKPVRPRALHEGLQWAAHVRQAQGAAQTATPVSRPSAAVLMAGRVLLVEDNPVNQVMTQAMLERLGLQVVVAGDGHEALQRYGEQSFDMVLMDVQMPGMDGLTATERLRELEQLNVRGRTPVVAVTGNPEPEIRDRGRAAGMDDFLGKPFTLEQLEMTLLRWCRQQGAAQQAD